MVVLDYSCYSVLVGFWIGFVRLEKVKEALVEVEMGSEREERDGEA